jgi:hypothetical protein
MTRHPIWLGASTPHCDATRSACVQPLRHVHGSIGSRSAQRVSVTSRLALLSSSKSLRDQCHSDIALDLGDELCSRLHRKLIGPFEAVAVDRERARAKRLHTLRCGTYVNCDSMSRIWDNLSALGRMRQSLVRLHVYN